MGSEPRWRGLFSCCVLLLVCGVRVVPGVMRVMVYLTTLAGVTPVHPVTVWSVMSRTSVWPGWCQIGAAAVRCVPDVRGSYVMVWVIRNLEPVVTTWTVSTSRSQESLSVYAERVSQSAEVMGSPTTPLVS